jgi:hypothetical protein
MNAIAQPRYKVMNELSAANLAIGQRVRFRLHNSTNTRIGTVCKVWPDGVRVKVPGGRSRLRLGWPDVVAVEAMVSGVPVSVPTCTPGEPTRLAWPYWLKKQERRDNRTARRKRDTVAPQ